MTKKPTLTSVSSGFTSQATLNDNFNALRDAFDNTLSRDGSTPNQMEADLDLNSNDILNASDVEVTGVLTVQGVDINDLLNGVGPGTVFNTTNRFSGDNSTTDFVLTKDPVSRSNTQVYIDGVYQQKDTYSVSGTTLSFTEAPPAGTSNIEVNIQESTDAGNVTADSVSTSDGEDVQAKLDQAHYTSRSLFVTDVAAGKTWVDGEVVSDGTVSYLKSTGATDISDLSDWVPFGEVRPQHFGAVGDGVADDYAAIQGALDYVNSLSGGVVYIPNGVYLSSAQLRIYENTVLHMEPDCIIRRNYNTSATGSGLLGITGTASNITIKGGTLDVNGSNFTTGANGFGWVTGTNIKVLGVTFLNIPDFHAIDFADSDQILIEDCRFLGFADKVGSRGFSEAIQIDPGYSLGNGATNKNITVSKCYFGDNPDNVDVDMVAWPAGVGNHSANHSDVVVDNVKVQGCTFDGCAWGGVSPYAWDNTTIVGNYFIDCVRGVYIQQGTGTKAQGCVGMTISGNTFEGSGTNVIFADDNNSVDPDNTLHEDIAISGNVFSGVTTVIRVLFTRALTITGNVAKGYSSFLNASDEVKGVTVTGNTLRDSTGTVMFLSGSTRDVAITGNKSYNMLGRFVHCTGATDAALRENITVSDNTLVDCSAAVFIAFDSGASKTVKICNNLMGKGDDNLEPSTGEAIRSTITGGGVLVAHNLISDEIIAKVPYAGSGGVIHATINGSPETVVTAGVGSTIFRKDGGAGTSFYVKESGTGNTGWVAK